MLYAGLLNFCIHISVAAAGGDPLVASLEVVGSFLLLPLCLKLDSADIYHDGQVGVGKVTLRQK